MVARIHETERLRAAYESKESQFVAVYGRRRVGKTYLIRQTFKGNFAFQHSGLAKGGMAKQLRHFQESLKDFGWINQSPLRSWADAFRELKALLSGSEREKKIVFIDEMPWLDTPRSDFLVELEAFWNGWASAREDILLIVCGSAASWIVKKLFRNKGGLHNRVTERIHLSPFTLKECSEYASEKKLALSRKGIAECYMALGGIPYYWNYLERGLSVAQNFDRMFFAEEAPLKHEFDELYSSLFRSAKGHLKIIKALGGKKIGMTREELSRATGMKSSGQFSKLLEALEQCGFIRKYNILGCKKMAVYQLIDCFSLFHFRFLTETDGLDEHWWSHSVASPRQANWRGLAFERLCLLHIMQLKMKLGIAGVLTNVHSWMHVPDDVYPEGAQIDLVLDRADNVINVCEMKYCNGSYAITKEEREKMDNRLEMFRSVTGTNKAIHLTMVTARGIVRNDYADSVQSEVTLDDLFAC